MEKCPNHRVKRRRISFASASDVAAAAAAAVVAAAPFLIRSSLYPFRYSLSLSLSLVVFGIHEFGQRSARLCATGATCK